jgi:hypothetical protein
MSPKGQGLPEGPSDQRQKPSCQGKVLACLQGGQAGPWDENIGLAALEGYEEKNRTDQFPFY